MTNEQASTLRRLEAQGYERITGRAAADASLVQVQHPDTFRGGYCIAYWIDPRGETTRHITHYQHQS